MNHPLLCGSFCASQASSQRLQLKSVDTSPWYADSLTQQLPYRCQHPLVCLFRY